jgi:anti-anti-sigma factor
MPTTIKTEGAVVIATPQGPLIGGPETNHFEETIRKQIEKNNLKLAVDLTHATTITTPGLAVLVSAHVNYEKRQGSVRLCHLSRSVKNVFHVTKLDTVLGISETLEQALIALVS